MSIEHIEWKTDEDGVSLTEDTCIQAATSGMRGAWLVGRDGTHYQFVLSSGATTFGYHYSNHAMQVAEALGLPHPVVRLTERDAGYVIQHPQIVGAVRLRPQPRWWKPWTWRDDKEEES